VSSWGERCSSKFSYNIVGNFVQDSYTTITSREKFVLLDSWIKQSDNWLVHFKLFDQSWEQEWKSTRRADWFISNFLTNRGNKNENQLEELIVGSFQTFWPIMGTRMIINSKSWLVHFKLFDQSWEQEWKSTRRADWLISNFLTNHGNKNENLLEERTFRQIRCQEIRNGSSVRPLKRRRRIRQIDRL
jgi:hypothetical protein